MRSLWLLRFKYEIFLSEIVVADYLEILNSICTLIIKTIIKTYINCIPFNKIAFLKSFAAIFFRETGVWFFFVVVQHCMCVPFHTMIYYLYIGTGIFFQWLFFGYFLRRFYIFSWTAQLKCTFLIICKLNYIFQNEW